MGLNVTGVPLEFVATLNTDNLDVQIEEAVQKIVEFGEASKDITKQAGPGEAVQEWKDLSGAITSNLSALDQLGQAAKDLAPTWQQLNSLFHGLFHGKSGDESLGAQWQQIKAGKLTFEQFIQTLNLTEDQAAKVMEKMNKLGMIGGLGKGMSEGMQEAANAAEEMGKKVEEVEFIIRDAAEKSDPLWKSQADTVEKLGEKWDRSADDLKKYFEALDAYTREGYEVKVGQSTGPTGATESTQQDPNSSGDAFPTQIVGIDADLLKESKKILEALDDETKQYIATISSLRGKLAENAAAQKILNQQRKDQSISTKEFQQASQALAAQEKVLQDNLRDTLAAQKAYDAQNRDSIDAITTKKALLAQLADQWNKLSEEERSMPDIGGQIKADFMALRQEIGQLTLEKFTQGAEKSVTALQELRKLRNQIASADPNDPGLDAMLQRAGELNDKLADTNAAIKIIGSDTAGIDAAVSAVRGVIGGFTALQGAIGLFSDDTEAVEETIKQVTSAMAILNGVQEVAQVLDKSSALNQFLLVKLRQQNVAATAAQTGATVALTAAETAQAGAATVATAATRGLTAAMMANPALVLLSALTAIVLVVRAFADESEEAAKKQRDLFATLSDVNDVLTKMLDLQLQLMGDKASLAKQAVDMAQAEGKSENEVLSLRIRAVQQTRADYDFKLKALHANSQNIALVKQVLIEKQKELAALEYQGILNGRLSKQEKERVEALKQNVGSLESYLNPILDAQQGFKDAANEEAQLRAEQARKAREDALRSATAEAEARLALVQKNTHEETQLQIAAIKARTKEELANVNLTKGERAKIHAEEQEAIEEINRKAYVRMLQNEESVLQTRLNMVKEGSAEELQIRLEMIDKAAERELAAAGLTEEKIDEIISSRDKKKADTSKGFIFERASEELQAEIAAINTRLQVVGEGTAKELFLRQDLVEKQSALDILSAQNSIKNETLLAAKIKEINTEAMREKKRLADEFVEFQLEHNRKLIEQEVALKNAQLENVMGDPTASEETKYQAQREINVNVKDSLIKQLQEVDFAIGKSLTLGYGNINKLMERRVDLYVQILKLVGQINNNEKAEQERKIDEQIARIQKLSSALSQVAQSFQGINDGISEIIGTLAQVAQTASQVREGFKSMNDPNASFAEQASGALMAFSALVNVIKAIDDIGRKRREADRQFRDEEAAALTRAFVGEQEITMEYRARAREQVLINKLQLEGIEAQKKLFELQKNQVAAQIKTVQEALGKLNPLDVINTVGMSPADLQALQQALGTAGDLSKLSYDQLNDLFISGRLTGAAKDLFETLRKLKEEGADIERMREELERKKQEFFTGTTADAIIDSIAEGFASGKRSAQDFASDFREMMKKAIIEALKFRYLEGPIKEFYELFAKAAESDGALTDVEISQLQDMYNTILKNAEDKFKQLQQISGLSFDGASDQNTLKGAFKGMTEETANLLAGQFGGLRMTALDILTMSGQIFRELQRIEANTASTVVRMDRLLSKFDAYESGALKLNVIPH